MSNETHGIRVELTTSADTSQLEAGMRRIEGAANRLGQQGVAAAPASPQAGFDRAAQAVKRWQGAVERFRSGMRQAREELVVDKDRKGAKATKASAAGLDSLVAAHRRLARSASEDTARRTRAVLGVEAALVGHLKRLTGRDGQAKEEADARTIRRASRVAKTLRALHGDVSDMQRRDLEQLEAFRGRISDRHAWRSSRDVRADLGFDRDRAESARRLAAVRHRALGNTYAGARELITAPARITQPLTTSAIAGAAVGAVTARAGTSALSSRIEVEAAETTLRIFGSELGRNGSERTMMTPAEVRAIRRGDGRWRGLDEISTENGLSATTGLRAFTEVSKLGIDREKAKQWTESILGAGAGMDMDTTAMTRLVGRLSSNIGGGLDNAGLKKIMNGIAIASSATAANPDEIMSGMNRGMGAISLGMDPQDLAAWVAGGIGAGIQSGKTGNFIATLLQKGVGAKFSRGQNRRDMDEASRMLGLGSVSGMSRRATADPSGFLEDMLDRMSTMDPQKRSKVSSLLGGQEWDDEILQLRQAKEEVRKVRESQKDERNDNFLPESRDLKNNSMKQLWARLKSRFGMIWESLGEGFSNTFREVAEYFVMSGRAIDRDAITGVARNFFTSLVKGLGFSSWKQLLEKAFGSEGKTDVKSWQQPVENFANGFGETIKSYKDMVSGILGKVGVTDAGSLGKLAGHFLALSASLIVIRPLVGVLTAVGVGLGVLASGLKMLSGVGAFLGLTGAGGAATGGLFGAILGKGQTLKTLGAGILGRLGVSGFAGMGAGAMGSMAMTKLGMAGGLLAGVTGLLVTAGGIIAAGFLAKIANHFNILKPPELSMRGIVEFLDPGLASRLYGDKTGKAEDGQTLPPGDGATPLVPHDKPAEEPKGIWRQTLEALGLVAYRPDRGDRLDHPAHGWRDLIQPAAFTSGPIDDLRRSVEKMGATFNLASITNPSLGRSVRETLSPPAPSQGGYGSILGSGSGTFPGQGTGDRVRDLFGDRYRSMPNMQVPDWYKNGGAARSRGGLRGMGGGGATPGGLAGYGANPGAYKPFLDYVAKAEGTAGQPGDGYKTSLDYGKWLPDGKEQDLTKLTLDQVDQLQTGMLNNPGNRAKYGNGSGSSAMGRYQIVRKTLRGLRGKLGLKGDDLFDEKMQDRLGAELARGRGANPTGLGQEWASLRGGKAQEAASLLAQVPSTAGTTPGDRPAEAAAMGQGGNAGGRQVGTNIPSVDGIGGVTQNQGSATHRRQPITKGLLNQIGIAAKATGLNAEIYSGGQDAHGPNRTGSHRHDHGNSADLKLYDLDAQGRKRYLSMNNEADRGRMEAFIKNSVKAGANGVGSGPGYMGDKGIHIGGGSPLAWGAGGRAANAPDWVRRAHAQGMAERGQAMPQPNAVAEAGKAPAAPGKVDLGDRFTSTGWKPQADTSKAPSGSEKAAIGDGFTSSGWKPQKDVADWKEKLGLDKLAPNLTPKGSPSLDPTLRNSLEKSMIGRSPVDVLNQDTVRSLGRSAVPADIISNVPKPSGAQKMIEQVPTPSMDRAGPGGGQGASSGGPVQVTQHIHGAGKNPQELGNDIHRRFNEAMNFRTNDFEVGIGFG